MVQTKANSLPIYIYHLPFFLWLLLYDKWKANQSYFMLFHSWILIFVWNWKKKLTVSALISQIFISKWVGFWRKMPAHVDGMSLLTFLLRAKKQQQ